MLKWFRKPLPLSPAASGAPATAPVDGTAASDALKAQGNAFFAEGRLAEAASSFHQAIAANPRNAAAHFNLGLVLREQGQLDDAVQSLTQAFSLQPAMADALHLAGGIRQQQGDADAAIALFREAIKADPALGAVYGDLCLALFQRGLVQDATAVVKAGLLRHPQLPELHSYEGNLFMHNKLAAEAVQSYQRALALQDGPAEVHNNLAGALLALGRNDEALQSADRALAQGGKRAEVHMTRAAALLNLHRPQESLQAFDDALALDGSHAGAHANRAFVLAALRRHDEALAAYGRALQLDPEQAGVHNNLGMLHSVQMRYPQALASFDRAIALEPGHADALANRAMTLGHLDRRDEQTQAFEHLLAVAPEHPWATGFLLGARMHSCDWNGREALIEKAVQGIRAGRKAIVPFGWLAVSDSAQLQYECSRIYMAATYPPPAHMLGQTRPQPQPPDQRDANGKIRVAYLSADLHNHATAYLMAEFFERHDRLRFETTALSFGPDTPGEMRSRLKLAFDRFEDVRAKSDAEIAQRLRELQIDIAVDLKGFTTDARMGIFGYRAAPVQVSWIGYPGTLGADCMDYILADAQVVSPDVEPWYSEKVVYLPDSYQSNDSQRRIADETPTRAQQGLPEEGFVFCCFNNNYKITPQVFDVWMRLLTQVPGSVLWLLQDNAQAARNLRAEAVRRGVDAERLVFAPRLPLDQHLARHRLAGLFLDTLPYNAHTTASDALWTGLPVVTCKGEAFAARVAASLLHAVGLPELVTHNLADYEALALELATQPGRLAALRERLVAHKDSAPLFDAARLCRHVESAYEVMWKRAGKGIAPESFSVAPSPCGRGLG